jgi:hypothetical protein
MGCRSAGSTKKAGCASRKRQSLKEPPARWRQRTIPCTGGRGDRPAESSMTSSQTALSGIGVMLNFAHVLDRVGRRLPLPSDWHSASPGIGALGVRASETGMLMLSSMTRSGNAFRRGRRGAHTSSRSAYRTAAWRYGRRIDGVLKRNHRPSTQKINAGPAETISGTVPWDANGL